MLARAWVHRMQYCLNAEKKALANPHTSAEAYSEPTEFTRLAATASGHLAKQIRDIRNIMAQ